MSLTTDSSTRGRTGFTGLRATTAPRADVSETLTDTTEQLGGGAVPAAPAPASLAGTVHLDSVSPAEGSTTRGSGAATAKSQVGRPARKSWNQRYARRLIVTDVIAMFCAALGVHLIELPAIPTAVSASPSHLPFIASTVALAAAWMVALSWAGSRDVKVIGHGPVEYKRIIEASVGLFGLVAIGSYLLRLQLPRSYVAIMLPAGLLALLLSRYLWRRWLRHRRDAGRYMSHVLAVGDRHTVIELLQDLRRVPHAGYKVVGVCVANPSYATDGDLPGTVDGVPILGSLEQVAEVARTSGVDTVAVTSTTAFGPSSVRRLSWELEDTDADLILAPALTNIAGPRVHTQPVAGLPLIHVDRPTYRGANRILKKTFDLVGSSALLVLVAPLLLGVAVAIKITSPGPVLFRQERVGINGRAFKMIKFRSMCFDAEQRLSELKEQERDAGNEVLFKIKGDPRVTTVGRFIRRFSIDEIPQLLNVLGGDMSLVGPRPPLTCEAALYGNEARRRLLVRPGMTGLWQVSGRSDLTWDDTVRLDVYYVENWSITGDLAILGRTVKAVVSSKGAY